MSSWVSFWLVKTDKGQEIPARTALGATCTLAVVTIGRYRDTCQNSTRSYMFSSSSYNRQIQRDTCQNSTRSYMHSSSSYNRQIQIPARIVLALQQYLQQVDIEIPASIVHLLQQQLQKIDIEIPATWPLAVVNIGIYSDTRSYSTCTLAVFTIG